MPKHIAILTGPFGSGKTTACRQLADLARQRGLNRAGIVCPARFNGGHKVGIDLLNLRTCECRPLAEADNQPSELRTTRYRFDTDVIAWGAARPDRCFSGGSRRGRHELVQVGQTDVIYNSPQTP
jgi:nucleoside-triphosphatase THEP1